MENLTSNVRSIYSIIHYVLWLCICGSLSLEFDLVCWLLVVLLIVLVMGGNGGGGDDDNGNSIGSNGGSGIDDGTRNDQLHLLLNTVISPTRNIIMGC